MNRSIINAQSNGSQLIALISFENQIIYLLEMKRPSNLVIGFILLIPSIFVFYALSRIALRLFNNPEIEIEETSQVEIILPLI